MAFLEDASLRPPNNIGQPIASGGGRQQHHQRTKSSVLKSFIHRHNNSDGGGLQSGLAYTPSPQAHQQHPQQFFGTPNEAPLNAYDRHPTDTMGIPGFPRQSRALGELHQNQQDQIQRSPPKKGTDAPQRSPQKTSFATISLKSLAVKESSKISKGRSNPGSPTKPKKTKSSTNLTSLLTRPKSSKNLKSLATEEGGEDEQRTRKDKENRTPEGSVANGVLLPTPIYAQFCSNGVADQGLDVPNHLDNTQVQHAPTNGSSTSLASDPFGAKPALKQRPKSFQPYYLPKADLGRVNESNEADLKDASGGSHRSHTWGRKDKTTRPKVMTAFQGLNQKTSTSALPRAPRSPEPVIDPKEINTHLEAMLDRRNIPENQRYKMRNLNDTIKMEFIRQDWAEMQAKKATTPTTASAAGSAVESDTSMEHVHAVSSANSKSGSEKEKDKDKNKNKTKRTRGMSFTLSKSNKSPGSPTKKKTEGTLGRHFRSKSSDSVASSERPSSAGSSSAGGGGAAGFFSKALKTQPTPADFVTYLHKVQKPELVEVGKLHKLRLLLRNETVAWIEDFVRQGGMKEVVGLLNRIMEVEWREEHEDALLHENLLCLKALCTTALAMQYLHTIQTTLFPALIYMLFDPEKKGPSEFTTRNIITSVLFTYIESSPPAERLSRAATVLGYLRDQEGKEEERPVSFVLEMRKERPYRMWCKEAVSVTKEVFWIFLHTLNVVALPPDKCTKGGQALLDPVVVPPPASSGSCPPPSSSSSSSPTPPQPPACHTGHGAAAANPYDYMARHFPQERPPVPAAPYVGGVEWDATNYLASHLELMNAILSCTPSRDGRNLLRSQLRVSGWERCMGASLRLCKEKFYGAVHDGLRTWVAAAHEDGWDVRDVRYGPPPAEASPGKGGGGGGGAAGARKKNNKNKADEPPPRLDMPKLDFGLGVGGGSGGLRGAGASHAAAASGGQVRGGGEAQGRGDIWLP